VFEEGRSTEDEKVGMMLCHTWVLEDANNLSISQVWSTTRMRSLEARINALTEAEFVGDVELILQLADNANLVAVTKGFDPIQEARSQLEF
jgi:hypothetical protein